MLSRILLVEDDLKLARIIKAYLEGADFRVFHALTFREASNFIATEIPAAAVLDLGLPDGSGEELCQDIKALADIPVIMLTAKSAEEERIAGFALGADDYVVKPASPRELVVRLKTILKRFGKTAELSGKPISYNSSSLVIDGVRHQVARDGRQIVLTPTEFKLLHFLASSPNRTFSREELVLKTLGYQFDGYERSIDAHIKNLRQKIGDDPRTPSFIRTIYGVGYMFTGDRDAL